MSAKPKITDLDLQLIAFFRRTFVPVARVSIFVVFFWFGFIKLLGLSPASPLAEALTAKTVGAQYFDVLFYVLAALECVIGILFLFPKATRVVIPLLLFHMIIVCSPLVLVSEYTWQQFGVPTLEGQYIIKNVVVVAVAIGIAASAKPLAHKKEA
ncbi:MAG TPA: hypothetical protein VJ843_03760 [Candidatus Saccharimonadales bacterium]|nr:hypothetical protein [Candidatus Saccharimonadales bacterium]